MIDSGFYSVCDEWGHPYNSDGICTRADCGHVQTDREREQAREQAREHGERLIALRGIN